MTSELVDDAQNKEITTIVEIKVFCRAKMGIQVINGNGSGSGYGDGSGDGSGSGS